MIKTFRGQLADGGQERIRLSTIKGKMGYRIVKFEIIAADPGGSGTNAEHTMQIWKTQQSSVVSLVNFGDSDLLACATMGNSESSYLYGSTPVIVFDREIFNQDIYITHVDSQGSQPINYYIELEVIPLDDAGAEYTTLKDMRSG